MNNSFLASSWCPVKYQKVLKHMASRTVINTLLLLLLLLLQGAGCL
jgi:hypothetical protein